MNKEEINTIKEKIKEARQNLIKYKDFKHYKKGCILNTKLYIKLLKENLKELKGGLKE